MIELGQRLKCRKLENGNWGCFNIQGDQVCMFALKSSAYLEMSLWNQWLHLDDTDEDLTEEQWAQFGELGDKIDVWQGMVEIMRERGMKV